MTQIIVQNSISDRTLAYGSVTLPDFPDVIGEWWLGSGMTGLTNRITGVAATATGSPPQSAGYQTVSYDGTTRKYVTTDVGAITNAISVLALIRAAATGNGFTFVGPGTGFDYNMMLFNSSIMMGTGNYGSSTDQASIANPDATKFTMVMGTVIQSVSNPSRIYLTTGGLTPTTTFDDGTAVPSSTHTLDQTALKIGYASAGSFRGTVDVAALALVDGAKDATYMQAVYARWRNQAIALGLTVS